jgi:hypothetical protein
MSLKLLVMLGLAALPFVAIALMLWLGPKGSASKAYAEARQRREALADEVDAVRMRLEQARHRLRRHQRELAACAGLDPMSAIRTRPRQSRSRSSIGPPPTVNLTQREIAGRLRHLGARDGKLQ